MRKLNYAVNSDLGAGSGTGAAALHDCEALRRAGLLGDVFCRSDKGFGAKNILGKTKGKILVALGGQSLSDLFFDKALAKQDLGTALAAWNSPVESFKKVKSAGGIAIKMAGSAHPHLRKSIFKADSDRRGRMVFDESTATRELDELAIVDHIIVPSNFCKDSYVKEGFSRKRVHVVPHGVDTSRFKPTPLPKGRFAVLFLGQIQRRKGILDLLDAWHKANLPDAELILAGNIHPDVRSAVRKAASRHKITLPGKVDPVEWFGKCHLFVLPSLEDGFGLVVSEAMASGRPVIVSSNVGSKDLVDKSNGFVVPAGDPVALSTAILKAHNDIKKLAKMGKAAAKTARKYDWKKTEKLAVSVFRKILDTQRF